MYYALFEEIEIKVRLSRVSVTAVLLISHQDYERARQIHETAIRLVPQKQFTCAKPWITFAQFEVRQLKLPAAPDGDRDVPHL